MPFSFLDHDAEVGLALDAPDEAGMLEEAVRGFAALITDPATIRPVLTRRVSITAPTAEARLVDWLREWVYAYDAEGFLPDSARVTIDAAGRVSGVVTGERRDPSRHPGLREIKAVTRHQAASGPAGAGWIGRVIFDV